MLTNSLYGQIISAKEKIIVLQGGTWCFSPDQLVITNKGNKKISSLKVGDKCLSHNFKKGKNEYRKVMAVFPQKNSKKCYRIKLKNGTLIEATEDHLFFYNNKWVELKMIIHEFNNLEKNT